MHILCYIFSCYSTQTVCIWIVPRGPRFRHTALDTVQTQRKKSLEFAIWICKMKKKKRIRKVDLQADLQVSRVQSWVPGASSTRPSTRLIYLTFFHPCFAQCQGLFQIREQYQQQFQKHRKSFDPTQSKEVSSNSLALEGKPQNDLLIGKMFSIKGWVYQMSVARIQYVWIQSICFLIKSFHEENDLTQMFKQLTLIN